MRSKNASAPAVKVTVASMPRAAAGSRVYFSVRMFVLESHE